MPTSPEVRWVGDEIGKIKIEPDVEPQKLGDSSCNIRISREVAIDLYCIRVDADQSFCSSSGPLRGEDRVNHAGYVIRDIDLLKKAPRNEPDPFPVVLRGNHAWLADLR